MNKKILMIAGGVVLLGGAAGGAFMMGKKSGGGGDKGPATVQEEISTDASAEGTADEGHGGEAKAEGKEGEAAKGAPTRADLTYEFDDFTTNLSDDLSSFVKMKVQVETASDEAMKQVKDNLAPLRDATIMLLSSKTKADLQSQAGKERLKRELLMRYQGVLNSSKVVRNLYISDFMVVRP
jgi:flagellar FliL protein